MSEPSDLLTFVGLHIGEMLLGGRWFWGILSCCSVADKVHQAPDYSSNISSYAAATTASPASSLTTSSKEAPQSFSKTPICSFQESFC